MIRLLKIQKLYNNNDNNNNLICSGEIVSISEKNYVLNMFQNLSGIGLCRYIEKMWTIPSEENMQMKEGRTYTRLEKSVQ
jgi:hypothetical protein